MVRPALSHRASQLLLSREALPGAPPTLPSFCRLPGAWPRPARTHFLPSCPGTNGQHEGRTEETRVCKGEGKRRPNPPTPQNWKVEITAKLGRGRAPSSAAPCLPVAPSQLWDWGKRSTQQALSRAGLAGPSASKGCCAAPLGWGCSALS